MRRASFVVYKSLPGFVFNKSLVSVINLAFLIKKLCILLPRDMDASLDRLELMEKFACSSGAELFIDTERDVRLAVTLDGKRSNFSEIYSVHVYKRRESYASRIFVNIVKFSKSARYMVSKFDI